MSHEQIALWLRARRPITLMAFDAAAIVLAYLAFGTLRYATDVHTVAIRLIVLGAIAAGLQLLLGLVAGVYLGRTAVASLEETVLLSVLAVCDGLIVTVLDTALPAHLVSRIVPLASAFGALFVMLLGRALWRTIDASRTVRDEDAARTVIFGAGSGGRQLVQSMLATPGAGMRPVALLDDDPWKRRLRISGVPVMGTRSDIAAVAARADATVLVIAIPTADPALIREVDSDARAAGLDVKVLPGVGELLAGRASIRDVRDINVADLLGRGAIETDVEAIAGYLTGKRVLVTGAGGSIGSELARQIHRWGPEELMMLDRDESGLHGVQLSIHGRAMLDSPDVVLADIRERDVLCAVFRERRPDVVFHAAALKHLPMLEQYPAEALKTNVLGTLNVLNAAVDVGVERFVNISTDKAADPCSVLGYSKRVAERLTASVANDAAGTFLSVRFGNVLASRGSVLSAFAAQIAAGGPVTVTHPDVSRYFMTVEEAVQLVIQAAAIGRDGEALILDMGQPVRIQDVAEQLIDQSGEPIDIVYTGLRHGEKLHESLLGNDEVDKRPMHPLVSQVPVPALHPAHVLAARLDLTDELIRKTMLEWCWMPPGQVRH